MRILDRLRVSLLGSMPHKEIWRANFRPLVEWISPFWGKNSIAYYKTTSPKRFRDFFRTLLYAFLIIVSWKNHISMRLRHLNFWTAPLCGCMSKNSCACPAWMGIASSYAERLVTYRVSLLYPLPRKEICGANLHAPSRRSAVWGA